VGLHSVPRFIHFFEPLRFSSSGNTFVPGQSFAAPSNLQWVFFNSFSLFFSEFLTESRLVCHPHHSAANLFCSGPCGQGSSHSDDCIVTYNSARCASEEVPNFCFSSGFVFFLMEHSRESTLLPERHPPSVCWQIFSLLAAVGMHAPPGSPPSRGLFWFFPTRPWIVRVPRAFPGGEGRRLFIPPHCSSWNKSPAREGRSL